VVALGGDRGLETKVDGVIHLALHVGGLGVAESDGHHADAAGIKGLFHGNGHAVDVLCDNRDGNGSVREGIVVPDHGLELGLGGLDTGTGREDQLLALGR